MGDFFSNLGKRAEGALKVYEGDIGGAIERFGEGLGFGGGDGKKIDDVDARLKAEEEETKRRKLLAEESLIQTSPTGAGVDPVTQRKTVTGV